MKNIEQFLKAAYLCKLAEAEQANHGLLTDAVLTGAGLKGIEVSSPMARGKWKAWHGSTPERMRAMKREGIWTMGTAADKGQSLTGDVLKANDHGRTWRKSENMAFVGNKSIAKSFITQALTGPRNAGSLSLDYLKKYLKNKVKSPFIRPLSVEIPYDEIKRRVVKNPEWKAMRNLFKDIEAVTGRKTNILSRLLTNGIRTSRGVIGGVKPSEIRGGVGWKAISRSGIKANPLRAVGGMAALAASLGLASYGTLDAAKNIQNKLGPNNT